MIARPAPGAWEAPTDTTTRPRSGSEGFEPGAETGCTCCIPDEVIGVAVCGCAGPRGGAAGSPAEPGVPCCSVFLNSVIVPNVCGSLPAKDQHTTDLEPITSPPGPTKNRRIL
jgi:hypothetical protein